MTKQEILNELVEVALTKGDHLKRFEYKIFSNSIVITIEYCTPPSQATINRNITVEFDNNEIATYVREFHIINCWCERWTSQYRKNWGLFLMQNHIEHSITFDDYFPNDTIALLTVKVNDNHTITYEYDYNNNIVDRIISEKGYTIEG